MAGLLEGSIGKYNGGGSETAEGKYVWKTTAFRTLNGGYTLVTLPRIVTP